MTELRQREPRVLCPGYLAWLRKQGCACGCKSAPPSDAAHIRSGSVLYGKRWTGAGEKPSDCWALPLKHAHHMAQHDFGSEIEWWNAHGVNPFETAIWYFKQYAKQADASVIQIPKRARVVRKPKRKAKIQTRSFGKQKRKFK
jgi:hypothetical protein